MPRRSSEGRAAAFLLPAIVGLAVVLGFVLVYPIRGFHVPIGSDTPVYVWWARLAGATGLGPLGTGGRPAVVALFAVVARLTGISVQGVAGALPPVLAASLALSAAAWACPATSPRRGGAATFALVALLTGAFLSTMVAGYASTLAFGSLLVAGLACLSAELRTRSVAPAVGAALLIGAGGLAHPLFLALGGAVIAGAALALLPAWSRDRRAGAPNASTSLGRLLLAGSGGLAVTGAGLLASTGGGGSAPVVVDTSRDSVLRRTGLASLLTASYRRKLHHDFPWWRTLGLVIPALAGFAGGRAAAPREDSDALLAGALAAWALVTVGGVAALLLGLRAAPGQRLAAFCLPVPILAGLGISRLAGGTGRDEGSGRRARPRPARRAGAVVLALAFVAAAWAPWGGSVPLASSSEVSEARAAGAAFGRTPAGTPLVLVVDVGGDKPALRVTRYANYLRDAVPSSRVVDVHVFVGAPSDLVAGRITPSGGAEHVRLAADYWRDVRPVLARHPFVVAVRSFDAKGFAQASLLPGARRLADGVVHVPAGSGGVWATAPRPSPTPREPAMAASSSDLVEPGAGPLSAWLPVWLAPLLLAGLAALGWPWALLALPDADPRVRGALAPAFGTAALALGGIAADAVGLRLGRAGAFAALALAIAGGPLALAAARAAGRRARS